MKEEVWKDIPGYEGIYFVSSLGRVKSFKKGKERIMKPQCNGKGYMHVALWKSREEFKFCYVHRLVLLAFVGDKGLETNHKDNNRGNNSLENLEWVSRSENNLQRWKHAKEIGVKMYDKREQRRLIKKKSLKGAEAL